MDRVWRVGILVFALEIAEDRIFVFCLCCGNRDQQAVGGGAVAPRSVEHANRIGFKFGADGGDAGMHRRRFGLQRGEGGLPRRIG